MFRDQVQRLLDRSPVDGKPPSASARIADKPRSDPRLPLGIVILSIATVAMLWAALFYESKRLEDTEITQATVNSGNITAAFREHIRRTVGSIDQLLIGIAADHEDNPDAFRIPKWIYSTLLLKGMAMQVSLVDRNGIIRASNLGGTGVDVSDREHFRHHLDPAAVQPYISKPLTGRVSNKLSIQFTRRMTRGSEFDGEVVISVEPIQFSKFFDHIDLGAHGIAGLTGLDGILRARGGSGSEKIGDDVSGSQVFRHLGVASEGSYVSDGKFDGTARVLSYAMIPDYPLYVAVGIGIDDVLAAPHRDRWTLFGIGGILTTIILSLTWFLAREEKRRHAAELTGRRRAEEERDLNRDFLDSVIESVPATIFVKNARDHRYILINRAAEKLWGVSRADVIGKTPYDLFRKETADFISLNDDKLAQSGAEIFLPEHIIETPNNGPRLVASRRLPIRDQHGELQYLLGVVEDVTERKAIEQQLRQSQKMEAVGNLTGGIAHDFNNLLTIIIGNLDMLHQDVTGNRNAEEKIETILEASERGAELTAQMLAFSRRQPLQPKPVGLNALILSTMRLLNRTLGEDITVDVRLAPELGLVLVDAQQLETALLNIAINARDAMPGGGTLTVATRITELDADYAMLHPGVPSGTYAAIEITDSGAGMPPEVVARIFEPFFTTKPVGKGTGLGLSMVYGFMQQSGGHISAYSEVGLGTTFKLYLPLEPRAAHLPSAARSAPAPARVQLEVASGEVILAVDDNAGVRAMVTMQLKELGYRVIEADNAHAALKIIESSAPIDLLFTDVVMPGGMNGKELAVKARLKRPSLKVLFTSGFPGTSVGNAAQFDDSDVLLGKPYRKRDLASALRRVLSAAH